MIYIYIYIYIYFTNTFKVYISFPVIIFFKEILEYNIIINIIEIFLVQNVILRRHISRLRF